MLLMFVADVSTTTMSEYDASGSGIEDTSDSTYYRKCDYVGLQTVNRTSAICAHDLVLLLSLFVPQGQY